MSFPSTDRRAAERFQIEAPVAYRRIDEEEWIAGVVVNISRAGILLDGQRVLPTGAAIELVVSLRSSSSQIICKGQIVRHHHASHASDTPLAMAAAIESGEIHHAH